GQSYRKLGELGHAREMYQQFLATVPPGDPKRAQVEAVLVEIEEQLRAHPELESPAPTTTAIAPPAANLPSGAGDPAAPAATAPVVIVRPRPERRPMRIAGLTLGGLGLGMLGGGVAFAVVAGSRARELAALDRMGGVFDGAKDSAYSTDRLLEGVFFGVGGAALATGIVLYIVGRR